MMLIINGPVNIQANHLEEQKWSEPYSVASTFLIFYVIQLPQTTFSKLQKLAIN